MRTADFDFELPPDLIAQAPSPQRDGSRLLIVDRATGSLTHARFHDLVDLCAPGDVLVVNTTKVFRARLLGTRASGGAAEVLLLRDLGNATWEAMVHPGGKLKPGRVVTIARDFTVEILDHTDRRTRLVRLHAPEPHAASIARWGHVPLPPYIARADNAADDDRYQTVYANQEGSVAAPTAGLHFTQALLQRLTTRGVLRAELLLHVGAGTFRPVEVDDPRDHIMHEEHFHISHGAAAMVNHARQAGHRIWAVGTTSVRSLESAATAEGRVAPGASATRAFIYPPYRFRAVDKMITNFHLPRSTLIMLVAAFAGYDLTMEAYRKAVEQRYRFYSYGDAMVVL